MLFLYSLLEFIPVKGACDTILILTDWVSFGLWGIRIF